MTPWHSSSNGVGPRIRSRTSGDESGPTREALAEICSRLDGLPLAIELAAARLRVMNITELAVGLEDRFRFLNRGARTALPRQQTLRAVVDWSYDLLFDDERLVFDRLSVFGGSCTAAAARVVCADDEITGDDVSELVSRLVDKSLVTVETDEVDGYLRYRMLQTLADYGRERLEISGEAERSYAAHRRYYADFCLRSIDALRGDKQRGWVRAVTSNLANLHSALDAAVHNGDAETAQGIAGCLGWYWWFTGRTLEGSQWLALAAGAVTARYGTSHGRGCWPGPRSPARPDSRGGSSRSPASRVSPERSPTRRPTRCARSPSHSFAKQGTRMSSPASKPRSPSHTRRAAISFGRPSSSRTPSRCSPGSRRYRGCAPCRR